MKRFKGRSIVWARIKANVYALMHGQCVYIEENRDKYGINYYTTLIGTCTGAFITNDIEIKKVFYERTKDKSNE